VPKKYVALHENLLPLAMFRRYATILCPSSLSEFEEMDENSVKFLPSFAWTVSACSDSFRRSMECHGPIQLHNMLGLFPPGLDLLGRFPPEHSSFCSGGFRRSIARFARAVSAGAWTKSVAYQAWTVSAGARFARAVSAGA